jgi:glyoxylase-like metal-dependent hydrolase (beta-lactamase superfamily II)
MPAASHRFQVGSMSCTVLCDGYMEQPAEWLFPNADCVDLAEALHHRGSARDRVVSPYTCLLVETGSNILLADTGLGSGSKTSGAILARLEMAGIRRQDVDTVLFTHAHPDHIGGSIDQRGPNASLPMFSNARYILAEEEWDFWMSRKPDLDALRVPEEVKAEMRATARRCFHGLRHQVELIPREKEILPGVHALPAPGHTPGHLALLLSSGGEQLLHLGDAATHPLHLERPSWENGFDWSPQQALATRQSLLERAAGQDTHVMAFHFPFPSVGRVQAHSGGGWKWTPGW